MTVTALMTAVLCIFGPMVLPIPVSPVPISLTNLVLYFMVYILGMKASLMSFCLYLLLGAVGLPVFSGFAGGLGKLAGPTGGYLLGFVFMTLAAGFMKTKHMSLTFTEALGIGVIPYLPGDAAKILLAVILGPKLRRIVRPILSR